MDPQTSLSKIQSVARIPRPVSRNCFRLQTVPSSSSGQQSLASPPLPHNHQHSALIRDKNSQSSYLKRVKMGSVRGRNESECNSNLNKKCENKVEPKSTFFQKHPKVQEQLDAIKGRSARSFMIRKKNNSAYSKKQQQQQTSKGYLQKIHKVVMNEMLDHSKELIEKMEGCESTAKNKTQNSNQHYRQQKPKSVYSILEQSQKENGRVFMRKEPRNVSKIIQNVNQQKAIEKRTSIDRKTGQETFQKEEANNNVKIPSNSSVETFQQSTTGGINERNRVKEKAPSQYSRQSKQNKHHKHRTYTGCKTIRVPWQSHGTYFNEIQNMQTKKPKEVKAEQQAPQVEEMPFGGISMIPSEKPDSSRKTSNNLESLKELFVELQANGVTQCAEFKSQEFII